MFNFVNYYHILQYIQNTIVFKVKLFEFFAIDIVFYSVFTMFTQYCNDINSIVHNKLKKGRFQHNNYYIKLLRKVYEFNTHFSRVSGVKRFI